MKIIAAITLLCLPYWVCASSYIDSKHVYSQKNCFSGNKQSLGSWRAAVFKRIDEEVKKESNREKRKAGFDRTFTEDAFNSVKANISCATFHYVVDGNIVQGYVIKPKNIEGKIPALIFNRGGNGSFGSVKFGTMMQLLFPIAEQGFVIIGSQYRGVNVSASPVHDQFGGEDVNDVLALLPLVKKIDGADSRKVGMLGVSRGGMQTFLALKETKKIKAVAVAASPSDWFLELDHRPKMEKMLRKRVPGYEANKVAELEKRSVLKWVDELPKVPVLILHGTADKRALVDNSTLLAEEFKKYDIPHKLVLYQDDDHFLSNNREAANKEIVAWFRQHL